MFLAMVCSASFASIFRFLGTPASHVSVEGLKVPVYSSGWVNLESLNAQVYLTGHGVYAKPLGLLSVNIYHVAHYLDSTTGFSTPTDPLSDIDRAQSFALCFTYLRSLTADQIRNSFEQMLAVNSVDITEPAIAKSLGDLTFRVNKGDTSVLIGHSEGRFIQWLHLETGSLLAMNSADFLATDFWRVWFAVPYDSGMKRLKQLLIGKHSQEVL